MQKKETIIVAQVFISLMMAFLMTGIFSCLECGVSLEWISTWGKHFLCAWPIAFCLSLVVSRLGFMLALKLTT